MPNLKNKINLNSQKPQSKNIGIINQKVIFKNIQPLTFKKIETKRKKTFDIKTLSNENYKNNQYILTGNELNSKKENINLNSTNIKPYSTIEYTSNTSHLKKERNKKKINNIPFSSYKNEILKIKSLHKILYHIIKMNIKLIIR